MYFVLFICIDKHCIVLHLLLRLRFYTVVYIEFMFLERYQGKIIIEYGPEVFEQSWFYNLADRGQGGSESDDLVAIRSIFRGWFLH